jgi:hypothetical protein
MIFLGEFMWRSIINPLMVFIIINIASIASLSESETLLVPILLSCEEYKKPCEFSIKETCDTNYPKDFSFAVHRQNSNDVVEFYSLVDNQWIGQLDFYCSNVRSIHMDQGVMNIVIDGPITREKLSVYFIAKSEVNNDQQWQLVKGISKAVFIRDTNDVIGISKNHLKLYHSLPDRVKQKLERVISIF